jgi:molecular chaperone DnaK (HSP70)
VIQDGRTDCIANEDGDRQIASVLAFSGEEEVDIALKIFLESIIFIY